MHKPIIVSLLAVLTVLLGGCGGVSESEHQIVISERDSLKSKLIILQGDLDYLKKENNSLRNELKEQKQKVLMLRAAVRKLEVKETKLEKTPPFYIVKPGDSLWTIARQFQTSVATLKKLNNLKNSNIRIGQKILLE